jgi:hypothetical protein
MSLGPAQVHPQEHLGPVGGFRAACAGADREQGWPLVVLAREQQRRPLAQEVLLERGEVALELGFEIGVGRFVEQLDCGQQVVGPDQQGAPRGDFLT